MHIAIDPSFCEKIEYAVVTNGNGFENIHMSITTDKLEKLEYWLADDTRHSIEDLKGFLDSVIEKLESNDAPYTFKISHYSERNYLFLELDGSKGLPQIQVTGGRL